MKITTTLTASLLASIFVFSCGCFKSESQLKLERMGRNIVKQMLEREAERFPQQQATKNVKPLTAEQAAKMVFEANAAEKWGLHLKVTSIDRDVARELSALNGGLVLNCLTSIDQDVAKELKLLKSGLWLNGLSSMDEEVAEELAEIEGELYVMNLVSNPMNNGALKILRSNPSIVVDPPKFDY